MWRGRIGTILRLFRQRPSDGAPLLGFAWYREDQWPLLKEFSTDAAMIEPTYEQWLKAAEARYAEVANAGKRVQKVIVDVKDMAAWCREMGRTMDNEGRSAYVVYRLQQALPSNTPLPARLR
jgi:hypothetical protein